MIVYQDNISYVMTEQHEHALLSEGFALQWKKEFFPGYDKIDSVLFAIAQHDRSWIDVDDSPIWNDILNEPYSFIDFPVSMKLQFYRKGIDEIELQNSYAALLCSIHYTRFFKDIVDDQRINKYVKEEIIRQTRILHALNLQKDDNAINFHYHLLKFCDNMSLFVCMQEAGVVDEYVHKWFKNGITQPFTFFKTDTFHIEWGSKKEILISPFPFNGEFEVEIPLRRVSKELVKKLGIFDAFHNTPVEKRKVSICMH